MIKDWHIRFKVQAASLDSNSFTRIAPEIIDIYLNKSINNLIQKAYDAYEETQRISDYLSTQIKPADITTFTLVEPGVYSFNVEPDYYFHLQSYANLKLGDKTGKVNTRKGTLDEEINIEYSAFKSPDGWEIPIFFKEGKVYVYTGKFTLEKFHYSYLKKPVQVSYKNNISSDIHEGLHESIIQQAVLLALETYSSERFQTKSNLNNV